jgi:hypothetical protein
MQMHQKPMQMVTRQDADLPNRIAVNPPYVMCGDPVDSVNWGERRRELVGKGVNVVHLCLRRFAVSTILQSTSAGFVSIHPRRCYQEP